MRRTQTESVRFSPPSGSTLSSRRVGGRFCRSGRERAPGESPGSTDKSRVSLVNRRLIIERAIQHSGPEARIAAYAIKSYPFPNTTVLIIHRSPVSAARWRCRGLRQIQDSHPPPTVFSAEESNITFPNRGSPYCYDAVMYGTRRVVPRHSHVCEVSPPTW